MVNGLVIQSMVNGLVIQSNFTTESQENQNLCNYDFEDIPRSKDKEQEQNSETKRLDENKPTSSYAQSSSNDNDPSRKFFSLKLSKPVSMTSDDVTEDTELHGENKPRSFSYSENIDVHNNKRIYRRRDNHIPAVSFASSRSTSEPNHSAVSCEVPSPRTHQPSPHGPTACDQAVDDITRLMHIIESSLTVTSPLRERTITVGEFNEARDAFSASSRMFVGDCRQLVTSAGRTRAELIVSLDRSMQTFTTLINRSRRMIGCLSAPTDKVALVARVRNLAVAYRMTISAAWRGVGKSLDGYTGSGGELKREVSGLTGALGQLVQTLTSLDYTSLVRRF